MGVTVTYAYGGASPASPFAVTANAVGSGNLSLPTDCGVVPGAVDLSAELFAGGSVSGTLCFVVPTDSPALVLYATADFNVSNVMFAT